MFAGAVLSISQACFAARAARSRLPICASTPASVRSSRSSSGVTASTRSSCATASSPWPVAASVCERFALITGSSGFSASACRSTRSCSSKRPSRPYTPASHIDAIA